MKKVSPTGLRKTDHIRINIEKDVHSGLSNGLEAYSFIHQALPELDLDTIDTSTAFLGKKLTAPLLISSMTGGTQEGEKLNRILAEAAQHEGIAMGVGSQRIALEDPQTVSTFAVTRKVAPNILLFANLGAVQLNYGYSIDHCQKAVDMIQADALVLHLNPLQEALQPEGNGNFARLAIKIENICKALKVPIIVKEVGWGISTTTAKLLLDCGVNAIDVAGAGGTSWSQVEMHRTDNEFDFELASIFRNWGIPTSESILNVKKAAPGVHIIASGGIANGMDITKCIALGASLGGMAGRFLKAASVSPEHVVKLIQLIKKEIQVTMFSGGMATIKDVGNAGIEKRVFPDFP